MVFRDEGVDFTAVLYICAKSWVVGTKDGFPGLFQAAWLPGSGHDATEGIVCEEGSWSAGLTSGFSQY